ncbi:FG-GAP-like repeat-containing protein [Calditrichota bacterium]
MMIYKQSLLAIGAVLVVSFAGHAQIEFTEHSIDDDYTRALSTFPIDFDGDGDMDIISSAGGNNGGEEITWWENNGSGTFTNHTVDEDYASSYSVSAADFNDDGEMDVVASSYSLNSVRWFENDGDGGFEGHDIITNWLNAMILHVEDIDDDGDMDIVGTGMRSHEVSWFENDGDGDFTEHTIDGNFLYANSVYAVDLDEDGDIDIVAGTTMFEDGLSWWENDGDEDFTEHVIEEVGMVHRLGASYIYVEDIDSDGDLDILGASRLHDNLKWWENDGDEDFTRHQLATLNDPCGVYAADLDMDGDTDLLTSVFYDEEFSWWENDGDQDFTQYTLSDNLNGAHCITAADFDGDGDLDVAGAAFGANEILWWENDLDPVLLDPCNLLAPADSSILDEQTVTLQWSFVIHPNEEETVNYEVQLSTDEEFGDLTVEDAGEDTTFELTDLEDDTQYWWRIKSIDPETNAGVLSNQTWTFVVVAVAESPEEFSLISPENGEMLQMYESTFNWSSTSDPDYQDTLHFLFYLSTDSVFSDPVEIEAGSDTSVNVTELVENTQYWWRVLAQDGNTEGTWSNETWTFSVNAIHPPSNLLANLEEETGAVNLEWEHNQPGGLNDFIEFKIYRDDVELATTAELSYTDQLEESGTYIYTVSAVYDEGESELTDPVEITWEENSISDSQINGMPVSWEVVSAYPNPFNPELTIVVGLPQSAFLNVRVYNSIGQEVVSLAESDFHRGYHRFIFNAADQSSGIYFVHATVQGKLNEVRKVVLMR